MMRWRIGVWMVGVCVALQCSAPCRRGVVLWSSEVAAVVAEPSRFAALRLRALSTREVDSRRAKFLKGVAADAALERATGSVLRAIVLGDSVELAPLREVVEGAALTYVEALEAAAETGDAAGARHRYFGQASSPYASALSRLAAEVEASRGDVDFCLSLADRVLDSRESVTRTLNDLSNQLLRAASYGDARDVEMVRAQLNAINGPLAEESSAYVEALTSLATPEAGSAERAAVVDAALSTFFLEERDETPLAERLGDAYTVALQRVLGELTRRGAIAGVAAARPRPAEKTTQERRTVTRSLFSGGNNPLGFNFIEWEMRLRRDLAVRRDNAEVALQPRDFVGKWKVVFVYDAPAQPIVAADLDLDADEVIDVTFLPDGEVGVGDNSNPLLKVKNFQQQQQQSRGPRWTVRPGPAHLDTCEFEVDLGRTNGGTVAFCGYVDRGQRIESRFSRRPIRVSGFAFEKDDNNTYSLEPAPGGTPRDYKAVAGEQRLPSGRFAMLGPLGNRPNVPVPLL